MTGFGKLLRTTAFRLAVIYLVIFVVFAGAVLGYVAWNTRRLLEAQLTETIETEINSLAEQYRVGGMRRLGATVDRRSRQARGFLYLLADPRNEVHAGNAAELLPALQGPPGWREMPFRRNEEQESFLAFAKVRVFVLPNGMRLLVGHDLEERQRLRQVIRQAMGLSILLVLVLGGFGAWMVSRRVLRPVEAISDSARRIMAGDMKERLPVRGVGDEFDRLAESLNQMLGRIDELMAGMRTVSDNIAHDLRTPLTRLRAGAEEALRASRTPEDMRLALERTIEESDTLIKVFNALLMIARAEAGSTPGAMSVVDLSEILRDVGELYEPVAEDAGLRLVVQAGDAVRILGNRELLGQALSNLVDNAVKYGQPPEGSASGAEIRLELGQQGRMAVLSVADHGAGVPPEARERILDRFVRLETSRAQPGFGLGLSLVAAIARLHGGTFRIEDNGPGVRAVLSLPVASATAASQAASGPATSSPAAPEGGAAGM